MKLFHTPGNAVTVTKNCVSVLRRLRRPVGSRLVWIDAICIDQNNTSERNAQVAMMGRIYKSAQRVVIDIGEAAVDSDIALHYLQHCKQDILYEFQQAIETQDALYRLYSRPWFWRVWVLQEVYMAREALVMCGTTNVPWRAFNSCRTGVDFRPAVGNERYHTPLPDLVPQPLQIGSHTQSTYHAATDLLRLLICCRKCEATDPRDKVLALLPMLNEVPADIRADYSKTVATVFTDTAKYLLSTTGLKFLSCVHDCRSSKSLPSWVPDWSQTGRKPWIIGHGDAYYPLSAGGTTTCVAKVISMGSGTRPCLQLRGREVDKISRVIDEDVCIMSWQWEHTRAVKRFLDRCFSHRAHMADPSTLPKLQHWLPRTGERRTRPPDWLAHRLGLPIRDPMQYTENDLVIRINHFLCGRSLVMTHRGYIGVAPRTARPGDMVCYFLGAGVPFILRNEEALEEEMGETSKLLVVGESYMYGLMEGEAFCDSDTEKTVTRDFLSC